MEQLPTLPAVASLSVLVLLCSATCNRLLESLQGKRSWNKIYPEFASDADTNVSVSYFLTFDYLNHLQATSKAF